MGYIYAIKFDIKICDGTTEDEMARWHHRLNGREFE